MDGTPEPEGQATPDPSPPSSIESSAPGTKVRSTRVYATVVVVIVVVVLVLAYVLTGGFSPSSSSNSNGTVLVPNGTGYSMVVGQFNGINFVISSESRISGLVNSSRGIEIYILTETEFAYLVKNLNVSGYVYASGVVAYETVYNINITVQPGQWVLSFVNPNPYTPTGVGFYSDVTLKAI